MQNDSVGAAEETVAPTPNNEVEPVSAKAGTPVETPPPARTEPQASFLRRFRLATRIWSLVAVAAAGLVALALGAAGSGWILDRAAKRAEALGQLTELNGQLRAGAVEMRRHEKDFLLRRQARYQEEFVAVLSHALEIIEKIGAFPEAAPISASIMAVKTGVTQHAGHFENVFNLQRHLGFTADTGLRGQLAKAAGELEEALSMDGFDQLATLILRMRGEERDFALNGNPKAVAALEKHYEAFVKQLADAPLAPSAKKEFATRAEGYVRDFKAFAAAEQERNAAVRKMEENYAAFEPEFAKIAEFVDNEAKAARAEFSATEQLAMISGLAFVLVILALCLITGWLLARSVIQPVAALTATIARLADRDMSVEVTGTEAKDEIGEMARAVRVFKDNLIETERLQAEQRAAELRAAEEEKQREEERRAARIERRKAEEQAQAERKQAMLQLADDFEAQVGKVVNQVSGAAQQLRTTAEAMSASAEETNRQATAVAAAAEQASANVQTVASAAEELFNSIQEIGRQVAQSSSIAQSAVEEARKTDAKVQGLAEAAQKIGDVVNLINDIASQTNLLALNATIEAARAGEAGKGFAVVASEVKSLATQTAKATEEIAAQISAIQSSTSEAVQAIQKIGTTIAEISEIATAIASAVEEQGAATREIAGNVQQAATGTRGVTDNIAGVTQAAGETGQATNQVVTAAAELAEQSALLRTEMDKFLKTVRAA